MNVIKSRVDKEGYKFKIYNQQKHKMGYCTLVRIVCGNFETCILFYCMATMFQIFDHLGTILNSDPHSYMNKYNSKVVQMWHIEMMGNHLKKASVNCFFC